MRTALLPQINFERGIMAPHIAVYGMVSCGSSKLISYQFTPNWITSCKRSQTTEPSMKYTMCCAVVSLGPTLN